MKKTFKHFFCLFVAILCFGQMWGDAYTPTADEVIILSSDAYDGDASASGYSKHSAIAWGGTASTNSKKAGDPANGGAATSSNVACYSVKGNGGGKNITVSITGCSKIIVYHESQSSRCLRIHSTNASGTVLATSSSSTYYTELTLTPATSYTLFLEGWESTKQTDFYVYAVKLIKGSSGGGSGDVTTHSVTVTSNNDSYGTAAAASTTVAEGSKTIITATPADGYRVASWAVSGTGASISPSGSSHSKTTTLTMGSADATVTVTFEEKPSCPTSGTLFSASVAATSDQSIDAGASDLVLTAAQATVTGGLMSVYNGQSSAKTLIDDVNSTYYFTETNNDTYFKIELDCALQEGDVIQVDAIGGTRKKDETTYELGVWLSSASSRPGSAPVAAGTSSSTSLVDNMINYTVTSSDEYVGKSTFYIYRAYGATQYFGDVTITRPAPAPTTKRIYMKCGSTWCDDNPKFFLNSWGAETHTVVMTQMTGCETDTYYGDIPAGNTGLLFTRQNSSTTEIIWSGDDFWGQSEDITIGDNDLFTCTGWSDGKGTFSAGTYATPSYTISFAGNGSTDGSMTAISSLACGADQAITANAFVKAGYSFANWTADVDVTVGESTITAGNAISDGATLKNISSDITLTAQWRQEVPTSVSVDGTWRCFPGQTITLTATPTGGTSDFTYQWQKYVSTWEDIEGATAATYSKENCVVADARSYRCVVSKAGGSVTSAGYDVHIYTLNGNYNGTAWIDNDITLVSGTAGKVELTLEAGRLYTFKVKDNFANSWFGNSGYMIKSETGWTCPNNVDADIRLFTAAEGKYVFDVDIAHTNYETPEVTVGVTYPSVSHPAEGYVYFAKGDYTWTNIAAHWWYWDGETATDFVSWANNPWLTQSVDICGTTYYYMPKLEGYNRVIFHNAEGDVQTSDITVDDSSSGKYILGSSTEWTAFATYTISFAGNGNTSGEMSAIAGICPNANQALTANAFAKTGYNFAGWKADVDVTIGGETITAGTVIADEATIQNIASSIALTAQWENECPTEGTVYSASTSATGNISIAASTVNLELNSSTHKTTVSGGKMYVYNGQSSGKNLITADGFSMTNGNTYFHIQLDCALEEGDVISVKVGKHADARGVWISSTRTDKVPSSAPACALTTTGTGSELKAVTYTVTGSDEYHGKNDFYIYRATSNSTYFNDISITRPSSVTLQSIAISGTASVLEYTDGQDFNPAGLTVTGTYSDASTAPITSGITWAFSPSPLTEGTTSVSVTATVSGITSSAFVVSGLTVSAAVSPTPEEKVFGLTRTVDVDVTTSSDAENPVSGYAVSDDALVDPLVAGITVAKNFGSQNSLKNKGRYLYWYNGTEKQDCYANVGTPNYRNYIYDAAEYVNALDERCYYGFDMTADLGKQVSLKTLTSDVFSDAGDAYYQVKIYNDGEVIKTLDAVGPNTYGATDMKRVINLSEDEALQGLTGTITVKLFWWSATNGKYLDVKDLNVAAEVADAAGEGVEGLVFTDFEASANPTFTEGEVTAVWSNSANNVTPASDSRGIRVQANYDYTMQLTVPDDSYISEVVFVWNKKGNKNSGVNEDYYIDFTVKNSSDVAVSSLQAADKVNETAWSCGELRESELKFVQGAGDFYCHSIRVTYLKLSYARIHPHMNLNTLCFPFAISSYTGATFYDILNTEVEDGNLTALTLVEHVGALTAGVPYFYDPNGTELVCYYGGDAVENPGTAAGGAFVGTFADNSAVPAGSYVTVNNQLYKCGAGVTMGTYRAYVSPVAYDGGAPAPGRRILRIGGNKVPTGVENNGEWLMVNGECQKIIRDGQILIIRDGRTYNVMGQEVR